jgi:hypothetical protein
MGIYRLGVVARQSYVEPIRLCEIHQWLEELPESAVGQIPSTHTPDRLYQTDISSSLSFHPYVECVLWEGAACAPLGCQNVYRLSLSLSRSLASAFYVTRWSSQSLRNAYRHKKSFFGRKCEEYSVVYEGQTFPLRKLKLSSGENWAKSALPEVLHISRT